MRKINHIVVHCSATKAGVDFDAADIRRWHKRQGWSDIGYHFVIKLDGIVEQGRPIKRIGAHVRGHNKNSIGICLIGGISEQHKAAPTFTDEQMQSLQALLAGLTAYHPKAQVLGHRDFGVNKACPCFDVRQWIKTGAIQ